MLRTRQNYGIHNNNTLALLDGELRVNTHTKKKLKNGFDYVLSYLGRVAACSMVVGCTS